MYDTDWNVQKEIPTGRLQRCSRRIEAQSAREVERILDEEAALLEGAEDVLAATLTHSTRFRVRTSVERAITCVHR